MKQTQLLGLLLFCGAVLSAQSVDWAKNTANPPDVARLAVDRASNVYLYGYTTSFSGFQNDFSVFRKYAASGELLTDLIWKEKFYISAMVNDGAGSFYFCGFFRGNIHNSGISLESRGGTDAFFGKMDGEGNIRWTIGFGGNNDDQARALIFNEDSTELVLTGSVDSAVYMYEYNISNTPQAFFIARFDLRGGLQTFKTYAFYPEEHGMNLGREIERDGKGGYFLLADRMGDHWNSTTPSGSPLAGRYIVSLDSALDIRWSNYVISSACYYGFSCEGIAVLNGEVCVPSFCSAKYGGDGVLQKFGPAAGASTWSLSNPDGTYYDTYAAGDFLFYVGNEEVNGCPCQDHNPGFAKVKVLNAAHEDKVLLSKYAFRFLQIVHTPDGRITVYGRTSGEHPHLQGHELSDGFFLFSMQTLPPPFENNGTSDVLLTVYPNPSTGYVEIVHELMIEEITVSTAGGTLVKRIQPREKACTIRNLPGGLYILRVKDAEGYRTASLLVEE